MQLTLAIFVGKIIFILSRLFKIGGGSAAPGFYALKIDPELVQKLSGKIPKNIVITGTNGKTTTSRMVARFTQGAGLKVIRNSTGSNLERGIASALVQHSSITTHNLPFDLGVWELDEAAFNTVAPKLKPNIVVFLNVFRDQLDRYGEIDSVVKKWGATLKTIPKETIILLNGDDANTSKLREYFKGKIYTFGVEDYKISGEAIRTSKHHKLDFEAKDVKLNGLKGSSFNLLFGTNNLSLSLPLPGLYHIYDAVAASSAAFLLDLPTSPITSALKNFKPAFGRVEKTNDGFIFLIKNPAGATQVMQTLAPELKKDDRLLLALNDNFADGKDVSWIWDADLEKLLDTSFLPRIKSGVNSQESIKINGSLIKSGMTVVCSGTRAEDMALRLKYAGFDPRFIVVESHLKKALREARKGLKGSLYILPTYTAMLNLQQILAQSGAKSHYWEEENN